LRQAEGEQQRSEGELCLRHRRAETLRDGGQGGQIEVGGDGLKAQQQGQHQHHEAG
jgi:hypothetical protein